MGGQKGFVSDSGIHECPLWVRRVVLWSGYVSVASNADSWEAERVCASFVWGASPGVNSGYDIEARDREAMHACDGIVVASAIFGEGMLTQNCPHKQQTGAGPSHSVPQLAGLRGVRRVTAARERERARSAACMLLHVRRPRERASASEGPGEADGRGGRGGRGRGGGGVEGGAVEACVGVQYFL